MHYKFNNIRIDTEKFIIFSNKDEIPVEPQVFNLIVFLIENNNQIVSRDQLLNHVWKGRIVSDTSINNNIKTARKALGDDGTQQKVIKTIHSRGYQFIANLKTTTNLTVPQKDKKLNFSLKQGVGLLISLCFIVIACIFAIQQSHNASGDIKTIQSIAVLPFLNNSSDKNTDYYGFAVADEIIGALNFIDTITVRPASSVRSYNTADYDPIEVGRNMGVDFILTGHYTINKNSNPTAQYNDYEIKVITELIDIKTQQLMWRDEPILSHYKDTFKIQIQVVSQIINALNIGHSSEKLSRIKKNIPQSPLAYEYYLRSLAYPHDSDGHQLAIAMLNQSSALDDTYAPTYVELGNRIHRLAQFGMVNTKEAMTAEEYYIHALSLNPQLLEAMAYLSMLYTETNRIDEAIEMARAMSLLNPTNANTHFTLGYIYRYAGMVDEAIMEMEQAVALDPKNIKFRSLIGTYSAIGEYQKALDMTTLYDPSPFTYGWQALMQNRLGNSERALELYDYIIKQYPNNLWAHVATIHKSSLLGTPSLGLQAVDALVKTQVSDGETIYYTAAYYGLLGEKERCLELLEKTVDAGYFNYLNMASNDYLESVKTEPEFQNILDKAKNKHQIFRNKHFP